MLADVLIWGGYIALFIWLSRKGSGHDVMVSGRVGFGIQAFAYVATYISAVALVGVTFAVGTALGMLAGYCGGAVDTLIMRLADILLAFPQMVLAIAVAGILGGGMGNAMLALGVTGWTVYARLARARVMSLRTAPYVLAARLSGCGGGTILLKYMLPQLIGPLAVTAATQLGTALVDIAGLSFLGIGVQEPQAEWGSMINQARAYIQLNPWPVLAPAAATSSA